MNTTVTDQQADERTLDRVRKLLAKAEGTDNEYERDSFMAAANALMAKYGIEQAMLGAFNRQADKPGNRIITVHAPWADVRADLVYRVAEALRCKCVLLRKVDGQARVHVFGFVADIERAEVLYTSLLLQMAGGLARLVIPEGIRESPRAYRRSWMLGFAREATWLIKQAEREAAQEHSATAQAPGRQSESSTALVLADRQAVVNQSVAAEYPRLETTYTRSSGSGYGAGRAAGARANIGGTGVGRGTRGAIGGAR